MRISLKRMAWTLALVGAALFIIGGALSNTALGSFGLIVGLTGVVWTVGLKARGRP